MNSFISGWYLLYTMPRQEKKVEDQLLKSRITFYCPRVKTVRIWNDRKKTLYLPMFPSYVFIKIGSLDEFFTAKDIKGVCNFVRVNKSPVVISQVVIDQIQESHSQLERANADRHKKTFKCGQIINIEKGSLEGLSGEFVRQSKKDSLLIQVELLNRKVVLDLPLHYVLAC